MAITVVTPSQVVPAFSVRELSVNAQRERALATPPSAITRISSAGKLRAELERQPIVVPTRDNVALRSDTLSRQSAHEEVPDASTLVANTPSAVSLSRPSGVGEAHKRVETNVAKAIRTTQQPPVRTILEPEAEVPTVKPQHVDRNETAPVIQVTRGASAPVARLVSANAAVENGVNTNTPVTDDRVNPVKISQTANEFVAAFTEFQNKRNSVLEKAAPVNQAQAADAPELRVIAPSERNHPLAVENVTRVVEAGSARFDVSTFAVAVARNSTLQKINPGNAPLAVPPPDDTNDTRRIVRAEVTHGAPNLRPVSPSSALTEAANQAQTQPSAAPQRLQNVQQNSADSSLSGVDQQQSGLAKHLNVLANLLTP